MATKHTAIDSRGQVHTRTSLNRVYTHAIITHWPAREAADGFGSWPAHSDARYAGNRIYAEQYAADSRRSGNPVEIVECTREEVKR